MIANLFSLGDRNYINNAVAIADALGTITKIFGDVVNFRIQFKKPFLKQAEFKISTEKLIGNIVGEFETEGVKFYFSYTPVDIELESKVFDEAEVLRSVNLFNLNYYITDQCRGVIKAGFEKEYGNMTPDDKVIFVIFEVPDTRVFSDIIRDNQLPVISATPAESTGERRFVTSVYAGTKLLGYRHSTVKKFDV